MNTVVCLPYCGASGGRAQQMGGATDRTALGFTHMLARPVPTHLQYPATSEEAPFSLATRTTNGKPPFCRLFDQRIFSKIPLDSGHCTSGRAIAL